MRGLSPAVPGRNRAGLAFAAAMVWLRGRMLLNIAVTAGFVFLLFVRIWRCARRMEGEPRGQELPGE